MFIDLNKHNVSSLTANQRDFLERLIPWSKFVQDQTAIKAQFFKRIKSSGLLPSVFLSDVIIQSNWGIHPLAQPFYKHKAANNLSLMEATPDWSRRKIKFEGKEYKLFDTWETFSLYYSDHVVFSGQFANLLSTAVIENQTQLLGLYRSELEAYNERMNVIISTFRLDEFDKASFNR